MKRTLLFFIMLISSRAISQTPEIEWQKSLGGTESDIFKSVKQTPDGGYIAVGTTISNDNDVPDNHVFMADNSPTKDYWVVKFDASGTIIWKKTFGGTDSDEGYSVNIAADGNYLITGNSSSTDGDVTNNIPYGTGWIVKMDINGGIIWQKLIIPPDDFWVDGGCCVGATKAIIPTSDNGFIMITDGWFFGAGGYYDGMATKINSDGITEWQKIVGYGYHDGFDAIIQTTDGGYAICGYTTHNLIDETTTEINAWIVKLSASGQVEWDKIYGGSGTDESHCITQTDDGGFIMVGSTDSNDGDVQGNHSVNRDAWILKLNPSGEKEWQKCIGGSDSDEAFSIIKEGNQYVVAGLSNSSDGDVISSQGGYDSWIFKMDGFANVLWHKEFGGIYFDGLYAIDKTIDGGYITAGETHSNNGDVGPVSYDSGYNNAWIIKLSADTLPTKTLHRNQFIIYPNPAKSILNIHAVNSNIQKVIITDITGKILLSQQNAEKVNIDSFSDGVYIIKVISGMGTSEQKFIKE